MGIGRMLSAAKAPYLVRPQDPGLVLRILYTQDKDGPGQLILNQEVMHQPVATRRMEDATPAHRS